MKPWTHISHVPLNHWFIAPYPNGEIGCYYQRIVNVRVETWSPKSELKPDDPSFGKVDVEFGGGGWWDISKLLGKYKHVANIGDEPLECGNE